MDFPSSDSEGSIEGVSYGKSELKLNQSGKQTNRKTDQSGVSMKTIGTYARRNSLTKDIDKVRGRGIGEYGGSKLAQ